MSIWKIPVSIEKLNENKMNDMVQHIGIEFTEIGEDYVIGKMPVDHRTRQPFGILHGGASVVLAETLGSMAANLVLEPGTGYAVGLDINSNHIKSIREGYVYGKAQPIHIGGTTQVWEIKITDAEGELINISRLTMFVVKNKK